MPWSTIIGQDRVKALLHAAWRSGRISGAYVLYGPEGIGKDALAMEFARLVNCEAPGDGGSCGACDSCRQIESQQHANVAFLCALPVGKGEDARHDDPVAKLDAETLGAVRAELDAKWRDPYHTVAIPRANEIKMSSVRDIRRTLSLSSSSGMRVVILSRADTMSDESQNALLKTLEEPPANTVFVLTTANRDRLQSTVRSRCQAVRCDLLPDVAVADALVVRDGLDVAAAATCAELAGGSFGAARRLAGEEFAAARAKAVDFLRTIAVKNVMALYTQCDELARIRDRAVVEQFLLILLFWFRDAEFMRLGGSATHFGDTGDALRRFVDRYPNAHCDEAVRHIETTARDVRRNANVFLALRVLATNLHATLV